MSRVCRFRWVWGRPQHPAGDGDAAAGAEERQPPASRSTGNGVPLSGADTAGGTTARGTSAGGPPGDARDAGMQARAQRDPPLPMERASSSSGPAGPALSTTPLNFPGMHAVRRSGDLSSTLDEAPEPHAD